MKQFSNRFDVVVVGGGHAGIEAALAVSRLGKTCCVLTMDKLAVGRMSCNPAVGGQAKGQMVREIDALGGIMGLAADRSGLQFKILNRSKGKAVWSPRAQVDKRTYEQYVNAHLYSSNKIKTVAGEVVSLQIKNNSVEGVLLRGGGKIFARSVVLTCGTFLNGLVHVGERKIVAGRMGERGAKGITESLVSLGFSSGRLKTGTPPRLVSRSINWKKTNITLGDEKPTPFSYRTREFNPPNVPCYTTQTNAACHNYIKKDLFLSPMFSGDVSGVGPRYCPSIEDKVHRFPSRDSHMLFLEPEWAGSNQIYTNGFSTSLPEKTQLRALRCLRGLEKVELFRPGYAIEYDFFPPAQLRSSLESKLVSGLFFAGQINGTSGYEEAAAQGLVAGANAVNYLSNKDPLLLGRNESYIGVLIDDLVTKDTLEPYRMFTSRAEYRLLLRQDNADERLTEIGYKFGLADQDRLITLDKKRIKKEELLKFLSDQSIEPKIINSILIKKGSAKIVQKKKLKDILVRPHIKTKDLMCYDSLKAFIKTNNIDKDVISQVEIHIKYNGYINKEKEAVKKMYSLENIKIPKNFEYDKLHSVSAEAREKLKNISPSSIGQATRISGVSPSDINVLLIYMGR